MKKLQEEFDIGQCWGTAVTADRFRWFHERGVGLELIDAEEALEEAVKAVENLRSRYRKVRQYGGKTDGIVASGKAAVKWMEYCQYQVDALDRQLQYLMDEPDAREEHPILCVLRGHYKSLCQKRIVGAPKLYNWLIGLLAWLDDEFCDMTFEEKLRARAGATLILRMTTQHPSWIADVNSSRAALATIERERSLVDPGEEVFTNTLSATEDAMIGLIEVRRAADNLVKAFNLSYETAILNVVDPD